MVDPNRNANTVPNTSPVPNQGGTTAPKVPTPRPYVAPPPHTRARKDSIVRPVSPIQQPQPGQQLQLGPVPPPPPTEPMEGVRDVSTTVTEPDGSKVTTKGPEGSLAEQQQQAAQRGENISPEAQESPIKGIAQGTYEGVLNDAESGWERSAGNSVPGIGRKARIDTERQLAEFGEYPGSNDPNFPNPPINAFGRSFNPFTGKFTNNNRPDGMKMLGIDIDKIAQDYLKGQGNG